MPSPDTVRLRHMRDAAAMALRLSEGRKRADLDADPSLSLALIRCLEVLGEAASKVSEETQLQMESVSFTPIVGMRNRLIHAYFDVNLDIVWKTVLEDLPSLLSALNAFLAQREE